MYSLVQTSYTNDSQEGKDEAEKTGTEQSDPKVATYFDEKIAIPEQDTVSTSRQSF